MEVANKTCCVYCHTNKINGKRYVGITSNKPSARWNNGHGYKHNAHFTNAIKKYGWDNFEHTIIISDIDEALAKSYEKMLINLYHSSDTLYGYNLSTGGEPMSGKKHSEETKRKMSEAAKGRKASEETRAKLSEALKKRDPEIMYRFSHSQIGKTSWLRGKTGETSIHYGKKYSAEHKRNIALARTRYPVRQISTGKIYQTVLDACADTNTSRQKIYAHCANEVKSPDWEYVKED